MSLLREDLKLVLTENFNGVYLQLAKRLGINPKILTSFLTDNTYKITATTYNKIVKEMAEAGVLFKEASFNEIVDVLGRYKGDPAFTYPHTYEKKEVDRIHLAHAFIMGCNVKWFEKNCQYSGALDAIKSEDEIVGLISAVRAEYPSPIQKLDKLATYNEIYKKLIAINGVFIYSINLPEYLWDIKNRTQCHFYFSVLDTFNVLKNKEKPLSAEETSFLDMHSYDYHKNGFRAQLNPEFPATMVESKRSK